MFVLISVFFCPIFRNIGSHLVITITVDACAGTPNFVSSLEHAQAQLTLSYNRRGNLAIYLVSPQGTRSTLLAPRLALNDTHPQSFI